MLANKSIKQGYGAMTIQGGTAGPITISKKGVITISRENRNITKTKSSINPIKK